MSVENYEKQLQADRLLTYSLFDKAESLYADVLAAEPSNVEAAFGLARVALERGDEQLALERAQLAARINPRFEDAQRLVDRLSEILSTRAAGPPQHQAPVVRTSEEAAFARNRSMADHRADEQGRNTKK